MRTRMSSPMETKMGILPTVKRHHLLAEFAGLKQACPQGVFVSLTPGDPSLWSGVIFVRKGPYAPAILRFHISFPDTYPSLPPLVTFSTDMFHPLITPLTTYMYSTDVQDGGTASASDEERLPPGGFSLRHGFPGWFGRGSRAQAQKRNVSGGRGGGGGGGGDVMTPPRAVATATGTTPGSIESGNSVLSTASLAPGYAQTGRRDVSTYEVLRYIRSSFDDEDVLDSVPLDAAGNPGAWHAWRTHRRQTAGKALPGQSDLPSIEGDVPGESAPVTGPVPASARRPEEWNWEGVWEERVKRGIAASLSEGVLYGNAGTTDELINFLSMEEAEVEQVKSNLLRTLGAAA
ncbi:ubiquitin-conjugating enzyme/RWD-like protein [Chaetomium strumarium]|uniref:Ubiquitin-conjugating enzyme/RWD-like protein n=1 Tax=Chaetomium strumarium TaxID=1170767 RepID=A0AAJ0M2V0_9PEZI|nr:ubiquitin-conjugating enzyme/RWD-like protein [Chaetomium strumarium]